MCIYYDLYESIWGGSPATEQLSSGLETTDTELDYLATTNNDSPISPTSSHNISMEEDEQAQLKESMTTVQHEDSTVQQRRELLGNNINNYKQEKLKRK